MNDQKNKQQPQKDKKHDSKQDNNQQGQHSSKGQMNQPGQPDKRTEIDDNPDETKKKIPNMQDKH
jgi:hypothetical protein